MNGVYICAMRTCYLSMVHFMMILQLDERRIDPMRKVPYTDPLIFATGNDLLRC